MKLIAEAEFHARLAQVKLLALDVDGVLTDGGLYYTDSGEEMKKFNVKDGQGLNLLLKAGIEIAIISASSSPSTLHRARRLGIVHVFVGVEDKLTALKNLCQKLAISPTQVAYIGDDVNDLPVLRNVGCPITVADAMPTNRTEAVYITQKAGGQGAVREVCDLLLLNLSV